MNPSPHIAILGAGFAALTAVRELRKRAPGARISLIAQKAEFVYLPSLIWIPSGLRKGSDLIRPLSRFLQDHNVEFIAGRVTGLKEVGRTVLIDAGDIQNDSGRFAPKDIIRVEVEEGRIVFEQVIEAEAV